MGSSEKKLFDMIGGYIHPLIKGNTRRVDAKWVKGKIILTNKNLWLVNKKGRKKIKLKSMKEIGGQFNLNQEVLKQGDYVGIVYKKNGERTVSLITSMKDSELKKFKRILLKYFADNKIVVVKDPVKKGGVLQDDTKWKKAKTTLKKQSMHFVDEDGNILNLNLENVQNISMEFKDFKGEEKDTLVIERINDEGVSVVSYIYAPKVTLSVINNFIKESFEKHVKSEIELDQKEKEIIMALYSGISPFDIPDFIGVDVDKVEEIYERLVEINALNEIRKRREVELTTRGRNLASKVMGEE
ncbi:Chemotaxis system protein containing CheF-like and HTH domain, archaellum-associated [Methanonatronarchaeum thermophilum]|uniref:Chemotaxis system protein containing CheF-like and HTH domain, archaellum-associated n=1 Tax=Methanonatronarchaeum thermophilum TaxID=1927129 RepID=A0A1Y3GAM5_9EURY|nr:CheF family chemotaxis protein [Methanonatronarchaeum thermophilum]OUJ18502.1 Chemotaxis system protein containing CheF-like and HTH domain, archaellum-associated [Methanonatronarchaeum thermophilum]